MIFVDASAIVAILAREWPALALEERLRGAASRFTSPLAVYEATTAISRIFSVPPLNALSVVERFLQEFAVEVVPITPEIARAALEAHARYGKGSHPARLNMGDCFAYACAKSLAVPLLYTGGDFALTDLA